MDRERLGLGTGTEDPAAYLAEIMSTWYSVPRVPYAFRVPLEAENLQRHLLDRVVFADSRRTGGRYYKALVEGMELDTAHAQIKMNLSRLATDPSYPTSFAAIESPYFVETTDGDTVTEVIGGDTFTEVVHA